MTLVAEGKAAEVERIIAEPIKAMGYDLVRVQLSGSPHARLQVMAERHRDNVEAAEPGDGMTVDDCASLSRAIEAILDVEDPISASYVLEVSSPGIDRPLTRLNDFRRFAGFEARIEMLIPLDGRRRFRGRLLGVEGECVRLLVDDQELALEFSGIAKAKLVLTDELLAASGPADRN
jgi:ribosome maturation factor RimP